MTPKASHAALCLEGSGTCIFFGSGQDRSVDFLSMMEVFEMPPLKCFNFVAYATSVVPTDVSIFSIIAGRGLVGGLVLPCPLFHRNVKVVLLLSLY